ncbi:hypothetical protein JCM11251_007969 [Rhodosporidiobolus azoricus]
MSGPTPSTSTADPAPPASNLDHKRKKLPACDVCKLRRLKCNPIPPPGSCPRCRQTGVVCTTTPTVRKKAPPRTGKRIEEAKATYGTADPDTDGYMGASNTPWVGRTKDGATTLATGIKQPEVEQTGGPMEAGLDLGEGGVQNRLGLQQMNGALVAHLLELYQAIPQSWLPIGVRGKIALQFEAAGRRLEALAPQTEVLARVTIALTSRLSSHPALFLTSPTSSPIPPFESLTPEYVASHRDLREFGRRREPACEELRRRAVDLAWKRGTMVVNCEESMASCYLLELIEGRNNPVAGKPYGSAFVSHLQTILNQQDQPECTAKIQNMSLGWSALIMREALHAANTSRTSHFTATDDLLLCGEVPVSIEEALMETVDDVDVRDSITLFFRPMRPYTYHCARLARECSEQLTGTFARRQPLNEHYLTKYLTQLDHLLHLFAVLEARIAFVLSPAATSAHSLPAPFETERQFIMRACLYTLSLAWSSLSLPVYTELSRRVSDLRAPPPGALPSHAVAERQRLLQRLELLQRQVHGTVLKGARMVAQCVHEAPSLAFLTHLQSENLEKWVRVLLEAKVVEDGGEGITREEREGDLKWMLDGLKSMGWSWTDDGPLIAALEESLGEMSVEHGQPHHQQQQQPPQNPHLPDLPTSTPLFASIGSFPAQSVPAFTAAPGVPHTAQQASNPYSVQPPSFNLPDFLSNTVIPPAGTSTVPPTGVAAPSTGVPPSASSPVPDLSSLSSLFSGVPPPSSAAPPPSASTAQNSSGAPDFSTLISLYSSGALNPLIQAHNLDVNQLAGQFLAGTLDIRGMMSSLGMSSAAEDGAGGGFEGAGLGALGLGLDGTSEGIGSQAGDGQGQPFDVEAMLAEPLFANAGADEAGGLDDPAADLD